MRRLYEIEEFEMVCDTLISKVNNMTLATDIICGFPTESEKDFDETIRILEKYKFPVLHISQFYPRPGTPAARMKRVKTDIVKARSRRATTFFESYLSYDHLLGTIQKVLVTEVSSDTKNYIAHNKSYNQVLVERDERIMGQWIEVEIVEVGKWSLKGNVLESSLLDLGSVQRKRIPRLVRVGKETVVVGEEKLVGERGDGAFYSKGNAKQTGLDPEKDCKKEDDICTDLCRDSFSILKQPTTQGILLGLSLGICLVALRSFLKK